MTNRIRVDREIVAGIGNMLEEDITLRIGLADGTVARYIHALRAGMCDADHGDCKTCSVTKWIERIKRHYN